jgi:hypothetical protein
MGTTADLAAAFMAAHGGHAKVGEILDELIRVGKLAGKDAYGDVYGALKRGVPDRFIRVGPGEFALATPSGGSVEFRTERPFGSN